MNQGTIWTVVHPTVGLPLLLGTVTVIALLVHFAVLSKTTWFSAYWNGKPAAAVVAPAPAPAPAPAAK
jgi:light-harvesting protein B-800-850 alpha chain